MARANDGMRIPQAAGTDLGCTQTPAPACPYTINTRQPTLPPQRRSHDAHAPVLLELLLALLLGPRVVHVEQPEAHGGRRVERATVDPGVSRG